MEAFFERFITFLYDRYVRKSTEDRLTKKIFLEQLIGQKIAFLCARYVYRGTLSKVGEDIAIFADAFLVEETGPSSSSKARSEDPVNGFLMISLDSLEIAWQPNWVNAPSASAPTDEQE